MGKATETPTLVIIHCQRIKLMQLILVYFVKQKSNKTGAFCPIKAIFTADVILGKLIWYIKHKGSKFLLNDHYLFDMFINSSTALLSCTVARLGL